MPKPKQYAFEVVEFATGEVVKTISTRGKPPHQRARVERGLLMNMDTEHFFVREVEVE